LRVGGERRSARSIEKRSDADSDGTVLAVIERDTMRRRVPTIIRRQSCANVQTTA
jgi:biotin carboxylase